MTSLQSTKGYDKTLTVSEQLAGLRKRLAFYLERGRDGTSVVQSIRDKIADLEKHQAAHRDAQARSESELAAHGRRAGVIAPGTGKGRVPE